MRKASYQICGSLKPIYQMALNNLGLRVRLVDGHPFPGKLFWFTIFFEYVEDLMLLEEEVSNIMLGKQSYKVKNMEAE